MFFRLVKDAAIVPGDTSRDKPINPKIIFNKYDVDQSGNLSVDELFQVRFGSKPLSLQLCYDMGHPIKKDQLSVVMKLLDVKGAFSCYIVMLKEMVGSLTKTFESGGEMSIDLRFWKTPMGRY